MEVTGKTAKKVSQLDEKLNKVALIKLIDVYKRDYPIQVILDCFSVPTSTYYRWVKQLEKIDSKSDSITDQMKELCLKHQFIYGYRTIKRLLLKKCGLLVNTKKVYRIMKEKGWLCRTKPKKSQYTGQPYYVTENKLERHFKADRPLQKLVTDMTYLYFGSCKLYLSSIMDLYNREIIAYSISDVQNTDFVLDTLNQIEVPENTLLHSDQGSVYTSKAYYQRCMEKGIIRSMSRKGTPADNACIEWFHSVLKSETFYLHNWRNLNKDSITDIVKSYITFYNETRIQRQLKDLSPVEYRKQIV